jgi:hypothetical protein
MVIPMLRSDAMTNLLQSLAAAGPLPDRSNRWWNPSHASDQVRAGTMTDMLTLARRVMVALGLAGLIAALFRLRGTGGVPPQTGGWREITEADLG